MKLLSFGKKNKKGALDAERVTMTIAEVCRRIGEEPTGFHFIAVGELDGKPCIDLSFHTQTAGYSLYLGDLRSVLYGKGRSVVAEYNDISRQNVVKW